MCWCIVLFMDLKNKPCRVCGKTDRYDDKKRRCRPCTQEKQSKRNQSNRLPKHVEDEKRQLKNRQIKKEAIDAGHHIYASLTPCGRCGEVKRYVVNGGCIECN